VSSNTYSIKKRTVTSVIWRLSELLLGKGLALISTIILANFLTPDDFGKIAMLMVFVVLGQTLTDSGFRDALIRSNNSTDDHKDTAFWTNVLVGLSAYIIIYISANSIAKFYNDEELLSVLRLLGISIITFSLSVVPLAILHKHLDFKRQFIIVIISNFVSYLIAIYLAYTGYGVWTLVIQILLMSSLQTLLLFVSTGWRPKLSFNAQSFRYLTRFGGYLTIARLLDVPYRYMFVIVIGKVFSAKLAGIYFLSEKIKDIASQQLIAAIQSVTYPSLSRYLDNKSKLKESFRQITIVSSLATIPLILFLAVFSESLFNIFLPDQWYVGHIYLTLMSVGSLFFPFSAINLNMIKVLGRSDYFFYLSLLKKALGIAIFIYSIQYGILGILSGQIVHSFISYNINVYASNKLIKYRFIDQMKDILPSIYVGLLSVALAYSLMQLLPLHLVVSFLISTSFYVFIYLFLSIYLNSSGLKVVLDIFPSLKRSSKLFRL
jgi:O-antigen/teichoic acid export membrane protein